MGLDRILAARDVEELDRLTRLTAAALGAPVAQINLISPDGQISLSSQGPGHWQHPESVPLERSFCRHVVASGRPMRVEDARSDPLVMDSPVTAAGEVVAYASVPLSIAGEQVVGALCVIDFQPRRWTDQELEVLHDLAGLVRQSLRRAGRTEDELLYLASIVDSSADAIYTMDPSGLVRSWNAGAEALFGYTAAEMTGQSVARLLPGDGLAEVQRALAAVHGTGTPLTWEAERVRRDGSRVAVSITLAPVRGPDGEPLGASAIARDISERMQGEARLQESQARLQAVVENLGEIVLILDAQGVPRFASPAVRTVLGYAPDQVMEGDLLALVHPEDREAVRGVLQAIAHSPGQHLRYVTRLRHQDGSWRQLEGVGVLIASQAVQGTLLTLRDVTQLRQAELALRHSEGHFQRVVESVRDYAIFTLDPTGHILSWNTGAEETTGYPREEVLGRHFSIFYRAADVLNRVPERELAEAREQGRSECSGWRVRRDGSEFWDHEIVTPLYDGDGTPRGFVKVTQDLTARRAAEERAEKAEAQLRQAQKMEAVGQLSSGLAHDFNNLLTVITGTVQLMLMDVPAASPLREDLEEIDQAASRAADLTRQLLAFARQQVLHPEVVDLNQMVTGVERMLRRTLGATIQFVTALDPALERVRVDPGQIEQVLLNMAINARDAMPGGGKLITETRLVEMGAESQYPGVLPPGRYVMLSVSDTGEGMPAEVRDRIFEPFFTTKPKGQGTGLGLSTAYGIIRQSGGHIAVYSEPGHGTTFRIYLPAVSGDPVPPSAADAEGAPARGGTVLIVEDEAPLRAIARRSLQRAGFQVLEAETGATALKMVAEHAPDLLLTDVMMPHMDGRELSERARALSPSLKVLFTSGYTDGAISQHGVLAPGVEFLPKPYAPSELVERVSRVLAG